MGQHPLLCVGACGLVLHVEVSLSLCCTFLASPLSYGVTVPETTKSFSSTSLPSKVVIFPLIKQNGSGD